MATSNCTHTSLIQANFDDRFAFTCNGCRDLGYGTCYTCHQPQCGYYLHKECYMRLPIMFHPFFTQVQFKLNENNRSQNLLCEACRMSVGGWMYVSSINGGYQITLHPCCINLPHSNIGNGVIYTLTANLESHNLCCAHCHQSNGINNGWAYVSENSNLAFHVKCIKEMRHQNWSRNYYQPNHRSNNNSSNNSNIPYTCRQRGLNQNRFRKRDLIFGAVEVALSIVGLGGASTLVPTMVELANNKATRLK